MFDKVDMQKPKHLLAIIGVFFIFAALPVTVYLVLTSQERVREGPQAAVPLQGNFEESTFITDLNIPTSMAFAPDGRLFVAEKGGSLRVIKNDKLLSTPFLTVSVNTFRERGLIGIAFDPDFETNRFVYIHYTRQVTPDIVRGRVSHFTASSTNPDVAVSGSEVVILDNIYSGDGRHEGGGIHFGKDGLLYISVGDGGWLPGDADNSQDLSKLSGKILRINKGGGTPSDNPFVGQAGKRGEIWAYGFRNPFTFAVDLADGKIYVNDVGHNTWEEVNLLQKGANYGWPTCEGPQSDDAIYAVDYESGTVQKRHITSIDVFNGLGYDLGEVFLVDETNLPTTDGPDISSTSVHPDGTLVQIVPLPVYYLLEDGKKRFNVLSTILISNGLDPNKAKAATSADLDLPNGPALNFREGTLIRGSGTAIYVVDYEGGAIRKRHITSSAVFNGLGYDSGEVIDVADAQLPTTDGPNISSTTIHPDGTLVRSDSDDPRTFLLEDGKKRHIPSHHVLGNHGYSSSSIKVATAADLALPTGSKLPFREGTLVNTGGLGDCSNTSFTYPIYSYTHSGSSRAITGGVFYLGSQFPSEYVGNYFLSDFVSSFIRRLDPSNDNAVADFYHAAKSPVDLKVGPDGSLYYLSIFSGEVHKIQFAPPNAVPSVDAAIGPISVTRNFSGSASSDVNKLPLTFSWDFGDGTSGFGEKASHTYDSYGVVYAKLTVTNSHGASSESETLKIIVAKCADIVGPGGIGSPPDGVVNIIDIGASVLAFGSIPSSPNWNPDADLNFDGTVNIIDIGFSVAQFSSFCSV